jgi:hypothetical protein
VLHYTVPAPLTECSWTNPRYTQEPAYTYVQHTTYSVCVTAYKPVAFIELFCSFGLIISNLIIPLIIHDRVRWHCAQKPFVYILLILDCIADDKKKVDMSTYSAEPHHATLCYIIYFMGPGGFRLVEVEHTD